MHKLTIEQLKLEYKKADMEGKKLLQSVNNEKEYTLNAIATIKMNAQTNIKEIVKRRVGEIIVDDEAA